jgi:hypothetical protein
VVERCTAISRGLLESPAGTASRARRWLLVEQPGPWGHDALHESDLPPSVATHLEALARSLPARVLLLRRTGGEGTPGTKRVVLAGVSRPGGGGWLEQVVIDHVEDLLELDLGGITDGTSIGGERLLDPVYLVCTNGKHDACCAEYGLPVARALDELLPERTWECSHVGGDRFAGNLVCLPDGIFYGHLDPDTAVQAVAAHQAGRLMASHCRGRSALPFAAQAAELLVRERLDVQRLDGVRYLGVRRAGDDHHVRFELVDGREVIASVRRSADPLARTMTCGTDPRRPPTHELLELRIVAPSSAPGAA